jgi:hypothetical protein
MNFPIVNRSPAQITFAAVTMGSLAMLRAWSVLYPSRHTGFTGSPLSRLRLLLCLGSCAESKCRTGKRTIVRSGRIMRTPLRKRLR